MLTDVPCTIIKNSDKCGPINERKFMPLSEPAEVITFPLYREVEDKAREEWEKQYLLDVPHLNNIDISLHEYMLPDLSHNYKISVKINDDVIVIYFDKKTDTIVDYGLLSDDGSLIKIESKHHRSGMYLNGYCFRLNNPPYEAGTVLSYFGKSNMKLGIHNGEINAFFERGHLHPVSVVFDLDTAIMEHKFNVAVGGKEVRPTCTFEYKKDLIDIKVAKNIGLVFEHKIC